MARLIAKTGETTGMEYTVEDGLILGRKLEAPVHVNDVKASREHARVVAEGERFHLVDLNSTNGTFVNENRISRTILSHGDRVRIGRTEFEFHDPSAAPEPERARATARKAPSRPQVDFGAPPPKKINVKLEAGKKRSTRRKR